jgi:basic amino acid/polyamine antiporter, APA family
MVVGIIIGTGIFRTPGLVAAQLGKPVLTFVAWVLGGALAFLGALTFAELATRHPKAGGKYVYAREAFGPRAGFVVGWVEGLVIYTVAIAAIGVVCGEYLGRLLGVSGDTRWLAVLILAAVTGVNLLGVSSGRWLQNVVTAAKVLALAGIVVLGLALGTGAGWGTELTRTASGASIWVALAVAFQAVIWTYYGYADAAKIAEEVTDPDRTLPRVFLVGIAVVTALYLLLNAAYLHVLPIDQIAASNLVPGDAAAAVLGSGAGVAVALLALLVVLASLNGNVFVTPRVIFGLAREGLGPSALAKVNAGGTPWAAMLLVGAVATGLAATGTFERLLGLAITLILLIDGFTVLALFRLRARQPAAPFKVPFYPVAPGLFVAVYAALFVATVKADWRLAVLSAGVVLVCYFTSTVFYRPLPPSTVQLKR